MKVVSFINEKGGTCKTTLTVNFASYIAQKKRKKTLVIDMDSQGHAGKSLGIPVRDVPHSIVDVLTTPGFNPAEAIVTTRYERLDIICSNKSISNLPEKLAVKKDREQRLKQVIAKLASTTDYNYVFIDSPPSAGLVTTNILAASEFVVVPVALTYLAMDGCAEVVHSIQTVRERNGGETPKLGMVIPTLYRNTRLANEIVAKLAQYFPQQISKTILGYNVRLDEAQSFGQTIWEYDASGRGAVMVGALAEEFYQKVIR